MWIQHPIKRDLGAEALVETAETEILTHTLVVAAVEALDHVVDTEQAEQTAAEAEVAAMVETAATEAEQTAEAEVDMAHFQPEELQEERSVEGLPLVVLAPITATTRQEVVHPGSASSSIGATVSPCSKKIRILYKTMQLSIEGERDEICLCGTEQSARDHIGFYRTLLRSTSKETISG
jgi:hypothetical protein